LQFKRVVAPASLYLAGKVQYRPWLPIILQKQGQCGWIKIEVLTVKVGARQFNFTGYGTLASNRITLVGWSLDANVFVQGTIASNNAVKLQGNLLVQSRIRPLPSGNFWNRVKLSMSHHTASSQDSIKLLKCLFCLNRWLF